MVKPVKFILILFTLASITTSCFDNVEQPPRTPQMEQIELEQALSNIESQGFDIDTTELGIYYVIHKAGEGPTVMPGDTCFMTYVGYFLDGNPFDGSEDHYEEGIWEFVYKKLAIIPGLEDGLLVSSKGAEIDFIIPSEFAYGENGSMLVPPYTTLLFSTRMDDLKPYSGEE